MSVYKDFEYSFLENGVSIDKYKGDIGFVVIPGKIEGRNVVSIADEAFRGHSEIKDIVFPEFLEYAGNYAFCECRGLKEAAFSNRLKFAGAHLFYNCRGLEKISIPSELEYIGDGFAKNCENLKTITITSDKNLSSSVSGFLNELSGEIVLNISDTGAQLIFPGFGYEYIDKCYSKTFETITHGAGVMYRKCIEKNKINYDVYDSAFKYAVREEFADTMCRIAINRLQDKADLKDEYKKRYADYILKNMGESINVLAQSDNIDFLGVMEKEKMFTTENIMEAVEETRTMERPDFTAELMDIKMRNFGRTKKTFDI